MGLAEFREPTEDPEEESPTGKTPARPDWLMAASEGIYDPTAPGEVAGPTIPTLRDLPPPVAPPPLHARPDRASAPPAESAGFGIEREMIPLPDELAPSGDDDDSTPGPFAPVEAIETFDPFDSPAPLPRRRQSFPLPPEEEVRPSGWNAVRRRLGSDRRLQMIVLLATLAVIGAASFVSYHAGITPVGKIRREGQLFDGRAVKVRGRVGDVYPVGTSYAFHLHQGRDTLVVFTRYRAPVPGERLVIEGAVSLGYLEGQPRAALFENPR